MVRLRRHLLGPGVVLLLRHLLVRLLISLLVLLRELLAIPQLRHLLIWISLLVRLIAHLLATWCPRRLLHCCCILIRQRHGLWRVWRHRHRCRLGLLCRKHSGLLHLSHAGLHLLRCHGLLRKSSRQGICGLLRLGPHGSTAPAGTDRLTARRVNSFGNAIVSESGNTARLLSKYRPSQPIIACVMDEQVQRQLSISWGITPLMMDLATSTDELIEKSTTLAKEHGYLHDGELAVVTAGVPVGVSGTTNMIKIHMIGNCLATGVGVGPEGAALANATGKACVCRTIEEIRAKFKPGMVLVVPSTSNEMLSYVRDAAALVVEEAGLNSHAAIAGKALLKPTIVGAVGATAHIRDGLMVAVDCAHGSVQRLQA